MEAARVDLTVQESQDLTIGSSCPLSACIEFS